MQLLKNKKITGGLVALALAGLVYYVWSSSSSGALLTDTSQGPSEESQKLLSTLGSLNIIKLDTSVFQNPVFLSLTDFGVTITPQIPGRRNPFLPIGVNAAPGSGAATSTPAI